MGRGSEPNSLAETARTSSSPWDLGLFRLWSYCSNGTGPRGSVDLCSLRGHLTRWISLDLSWNKARQIPNSTNDRDCRNPSFSCCPDDCLTEPIRFGITGDDVQTDLDRSEKFLPLVNRPVLHQDLGCLSGGTNDFTAPRLCENKDDRLDPS
jgi:hypothetical protein